MGRAGELARWLESFAQHLDETTGRNKGRIILKDDVGRLRSAAKHMLTLLDERTSIAQEVSKERASLHAESVRLKDKPPERLRLPESRSGMTRKFEVIRTDQEPLSVYITIGQYPDGRLGEVFLKCDRQGSLASGALDAVSIILSIALQYGLPLDVFTSKLVGTRFEPAGFTGDKDERYKTCTSILDLVGRWLRDNFEVKKEGS